MKKMNKKAFTLIELIVVIAVAGILVLLGIPRLTSYVQEAQLTRIQHDVKVMEQEMGNVLAYDNNFNEWQNNGKDLGRVIMRKELYEKQGVAKNLDWEHLSAKWLQTNKGGNQLASIDSELGIGGDLIELDDKYSTYKIIPEEYSSEINTKLKGTFYVNSLGKVYYEHDKPLKAIEKESLACETPSTLGYDFEIISGLGTIIGWNGNTTHLVIPSAFKMSEGGKEWCEPVRVIGAGAFQNGTFEKVTIPQSVEEIQDEAFQGGELIEIEIPHSVKVIGDNAFTDNPVTSSGGDSGSGGSDGSSGGSGGADESRVVVKGSSSERNISDSAFGEFKPNYLPVTDKDLGVITKNNGGKTVSIIGKTVTNDSSSNNSNTVINIPKELEINGEILPVTEIEKGAFQGSGLIDVIMPEGLLYIHDYAFAGNQLVRAVIPNSVIEVGSYAFAYNEIASKPTIDPINILEDKLSGSFEDVDNEGNISKPVGSSIKMKDHIFIISSMGKHIVEDVGTNSEEIIDKVDKSILIAELAKVKALNKDDYISGWSKVQSVIQQAEIILNDKKSTQVNIDETLSDLKNAINELVAKPEIPGPQPSTPVDISGQTGEYRFHGEVAAEDFITGTNLAKAIRLTAGTEYNNNEPWLKFTKHDEATGKLKSTIFVAKKPFRYGLSWDQINAVGAVSGNRDRTSALEIGGQKYKVRLLKGATKSPAKETGDRDAQGSEWNKMMLPIHEQAANGNWAYPDYVENNIVPISHNLGTNDGMYTDADLLTHRTHGSGSYSWTQETTSSGYRVYRGLGGVSYSYNVDSNNTSASFGWRPALELVSP